MKKKKKKKTSFIKQHPQTFGLSLGLISLCLFIAFISFNCHIPDANALGIVGHLLAYIGTYFFGLSALTIPLFLSYLSLLFILNKKRKVTHLFHYAILMIGACLFLGALSDFPISKVFEEKVIVHTISVDQFYPLVTSRYYLGGVPVYYLLNELSLLRIFSHLGTFILSSCLMAFGLCNLFSVQPFRFLTRFLTKIKEKKEKGPSFFKELFSLFKRKQEKIPKVKQFPQLEKTLQKTWERSKSEKIEPTIYSPSKRPKTSYPKKVNQGDLSHYALPSTSLLHNLVPQDFPTLKKDLITLGHILEQTLESFQIVAKVDSIHCGPRIASFEVIPSTGTKVQKIKALENDIALNLKAKSTRIIAPIPGKAAVGIEIPNPKPHEVNFKELLENYQMGPKKHEIPILIGKSVIGEDVTADLAKMPHCLVAGATGSGKSVFMNTLILSILMNARPDEIKLLMVDPKKVELTAYSNLPHMIAPVITEPHGAQAALNWLVKEMQLRYEILKQTRYRNILSFNDRKRNIEKEEELSIEIPEKMPYIVAIIDEFADLMMAAQTDIETPIARIAQMARAVGIHMVLATQRPSREVITGLIKANFPTRISFKVASKVNSSIVLDELGAERLLGNGDMLFLPPGSSHTIRAQGAYLRDEEIHQVIDHITRQAPIDYLIQSFDQMATNQLFEEAQAPRDEMFELAKQTVIETGNASTTFLQRKLKVGYARAASLMDELEERGIVSSQEGAKARRVLYNTNSESDN
jgi:S-DNA-T family DNA segregation ATPase FtsK/SpoIIIE